MNYPTNTDDAIDSRDVIEAIEALTPIVLGHVRPIDADGVLDGMPVATFGVEAIKDAFHALDKLAKQGEDYSEDWQYGATLIRDSYFEDYAQELAEDCYAVQLKQSTWPFNCIDWVQAADELKQDYTSVDFDGVTYWVR